MARGARRSGAPFPAAPWLVVRASGTALGAGGPGAAGPVGAERTMKWTLLCVAAALALIASVALGPAAVPLSDLLRSDIVWNLRVPRALLAFLVGGSLGVAGASLQALVRNPLADPF